MIDIEIIKAEYAALPNEALLALYGDSHSLTPVAKRALVQLLQQRGLIDLTEHENYESFSVDDKSLTDDYATLKKEMLQWKLEGQDNEMITARLIYKGISEKEIAYLMGQVHATIHESMSEADANRLSAFIRLCCGAAVFVIAWLANLSKGVYFVGLMLIGISIVQAAIADSKRSRYQSILKQTQDDGINQQDEV